MTGKAPDVAGGDGTPPPLVRVVKAVGRALGEVPPKATDVVSLARVAAEADEEHAHVEELPVVTLRLHRCPRHAGRAVIAAQQRWDRLDRGQQHRQGHERY